MSPPGPQALLAHLEDLPLARRAADGDRDALEVLLRRHQALVHRLCRRLCPDDAVALDAMQEAMIRVARRIDRFDGRAAFTTWLYRVVTNVCLDELRRNRRRPRPVPLDEHDSDESVERASADPDPADVVAQRLELDRALAGLAPEFRAAVVLRDVAGLDYATIAGILDIPAGTVRSRIARGRAHLARELTPAAPSHPGPAASPAREGGGGNPAEPSARPTSRPTSCPSSRPTSRSISSPKSQPGP